MAARQLSELAALGRLGPMLGEKVHGDDRGRQGDRGDTFLSDHPSDASKPSASGSTSVVRDLLSAFWSLDRVGLPLMPLYSASAGGLTG